MDIKQIAKITLIFLILLIICALGLTFAYFTADVIKNKEDESVVVSGGKLEITYGDNNELLSIDGLKPGNVVGEKTFTVTNTGKNDVKYYEVILEDVINELEFYEDLEYTLTCNSDKSTCNGSNGVFPKKDSILVSNSIKVGEVQTYKIIVNYKETYKNQSNDMNKSIVAKINLKNEENYISTFKIYGNTTLVDNNFKDIGEETNNLFDIGKILESSDITRNSDGSIMVNKYASYAGKTLKELASSLKSGDVVTFNIDTDGVDIIYLLQARLSLKSGNSYTITNEMLSSKVYLYNKSLSDTTAVTIRNISLTKDNNKLYKVSVGISAKNMFDFNKIGSALFSENYIEFNSDKTGFIINNTNHFKNGASLGLMSELVPDLKVGDKFKIAFETNAVRDDKNVNYVWLNIYNHTLRKDTEYTATSDMLNSNLYIYTGGTLNTYFNNFMIYNSKYTLNYNPYKKYYENLYLDEPLRKVNDVSDYVDIKYGKLVRKIGVIESYNGEEINTDYISSTGDLTIGAKIYYVLDKEIVTDVDTSLILKNVIYNGILYSYNGIPFSNIEFIVL